MSDTRLSGPWRPAGDDDRLTLRDCVLDTQGEPLAAVFWRGEGKEAETQAIIRLIAAAPEMAKALAGAYHYFERMDPLGLADVDVGLPEMVSAALAKAWGER